VQVGLADHAVDGFAEKMSVVYEGMTTERVMRSVLSRRYAIRLSRRCKSLSSKMRVLPLREEAVLVAGAETRHSIDIHGRLFHENIYLSGRQMPEFGQDAAFFVVSCRMARFLLYSGDTK
jgi:hypothetical protein